MNSSEQTPKLPTWLFIVAYLALVGAAVFIASQSARPLSNSAILWIVALVLGGAIIALVPVVANYERQKNEALDERQRALEALARTVSSSAEQISIAAGGLHEIAELAQKNLRHAEQLPHKLQDKIAEFQAQLAAADDAEKEEMERELLSLRTSESERLETVSQRIVKSAAEWTKLEAASQQHLAAANEALAKLSLGTASAIGKAQVAAEQALAHARIEAARALGEASGHGTKAIDAAKSSALAELDARLAAGSLAVTDRIAHEFGARLAGASQGLDARIAQLETIAREVVAASAAASASAAAVAAVSAAAAATPPPPPPPASAPLPPVASDTPPPVAEPAPAAPAEPAAAAPTDAPAPEPAVAAPRRPRKPRREEPAAEPAAAEASAPEIVSTDAAPAPAEPVAPVPTDPAALVAAATPVPDAPADREPPPVPPARIAEIAPVAPHTAEPFPPHLTNGSTPPPEPQPTTADEAAPVADDTPKAARKRPPLRRPEAAADQEPGLGLDLDDGTGGSAASVAERVMTSDGATRLLVTAYIGIGNRLFIRGEGPGLSWEKGVSLQFVSIGKWRWETNDASGPVQFKLYKNDEIECAALGVQRLDPGHQQEVTAAF